MIQRKEREESNINIFQRAENNFGYEYEKNKQRNQSNKNPTGLVNGHVALDQKTVWQFPRKYYPMV